MPSRASLTTISYALPAAFLSFAALAYYVYIPKLYSDAFGAPLQALGAWILLSRVFDALIDPLMGLISDQSSSRFGKRFFWIALGSLPFGLCFFLMTLSPVSWSANLQFIVLSFLFFAFWTMVSVPYEAMAPELSQDYDERTRLLGARELFQLLGTLACGISFFVLAGDDGRVSQESFQLTAVVLTGLLLLSLIPLKRLKPQRNSSDAETKKKFKLFGGFELLKGNKPLRVLCISFFLQGIGAALPPALILYYVERVLMSPNASAVLTLYLLCGAVGFPFWTWLARRTEKRSAYVYAMLFNAGAFTLVFFLDVGGFNAYLVLVSLSGLGLGGTLALPAAMLADLTEVEELRSGRRREGELAGIWSFCRKIPAAFGAGVGLSLLGLSGFVAMGPLPESSVFALKFLYAAVPSICNALAVFTILAYSINREEFSKILSELKNSKS